MDAGGRRGRAARATVPLLAGLVVQAVTTYLVLIMAGRALGATSFGALSALYVLITSVATGLFLPIEQEVARRRGDERGRQSSDVTLLLRAMRLGVLTAAAAIAVLLGALPITSRLLGHHPQLVAALCVALLGYACCFTTRGEFAGQRQLARYGLQLAVEGTFRLLGAVVLLATGVDNVAAYGWLFAAAPWVAIAASSVTWSRERIAVASHTEPRLARAVALLIVSCLASQLLINAGPLVVALLAKPDDRAHVGVFLAALVIVRVPVFLFTAVQPSFLPAIAEHSAADRREPFIRLISRVLVAALALVAVSSLGAVAIGPWVLKLLFGFNQSLSRWTFGEMTLSVGLFLVAAILAQALLGRGEHIPTTIGWLAGLVGLAIGTAAGHGAVGRAGAGFITGALVATVALGAFLVHDLMNWTIDPAGVTTTAEENRTPKAQNPLPQQP